MGKYTNLDKFKEIKIGIGNEINLFYNDEDAIYHDSNYLTWFGGSYRYGIIYRRARYVNTENSNIRSIIRMGISILINKR